MKIFNKRAGFNYELLDKYEAGVVLTGAEAKAFRRGDVDLTRAFAKPINGEIYLINAGFSIYGDDKADPRRSRRLLLHKREIVDIEVKIKQKRLTLVPISVYNMGRLIKVELALARSKREFQKKDKVKSADIERDVQRALRGSKD